MAEKTSPNKGRINLEHPEMRTSYANFSHIHVNPTDVYLYFGIQSPDGNLEDINVDTRIIITHDAFMRMMEFWSARYSVLAKIYGDTPRNLHDFDAAKVNAAFNEFLATPEKEDVQDKTDA